jgi:hypothetical protein
MNWRERHIHVPMAVTPLENGDTTMPHNLEQGKVLYRRESP